MLEEELLRNKDAILNAAKRLNWKTTLAQQYLNERFRAEGGKPLKNGKPFNDDRNIISMAALNIDIKDLPEEEARARMLEEIKNITDAYFEKSDMKPYIKKMYDNAARTDNIDWSDERQVEKIFATIGASQALSTVTSDFPKEMSELYPTHDDVSKIDAIIAIPNMIFFNVAGALQKSGLGEEVQKYVPMGLKAGSAVHGSPNLQVEHDTAIQAYEAALRDEKTVVLDPGVNEHSKNFFLGNSVSMTNAHTEEEYNEDNYAKDFMTSISELSRNTSMEQIMVKTLIKAARAKDVDYDERDLLFINGKSINEIIEEKKERGATAYEANREVAQMFKDALLDGKSVVTLMRFSYTPDGKTKFHHQDIKVDLDKLNEIDRKETNYSRFRRFLDKIKIFKIKKHASNSERDKKQEKFKKNKKFQEALRRAEDRAIEIYNNIDLKAGGITNLINTIPRIKRDETELDKKAAKGKETENTKVNEKTVITPEKTRVDFPKDEFINDNPVVKTSTKEKIEEKKLTNDSPAKNP